GGRPIGGDRRRGPSAAATAFDPATDHDRVTRTADVLIIGAGAFGAATAHQLATRGARVTVLDRRAVASQTSPRAAGLASTVRGTDLMTVIASRAATMLAEIEAESGQDFGIVRPGSLKLARMLEDVTVLVAEQERATRHALGAQLIHADDVSTLHPLLEPAGILAALHVPSDLYFEPSQVAIGLVLAAARAGAAFVPEAEVSGIRRDGDRVTGVETDRGTFSAGVVVDAAGAWAGQLAALAGVRIPLVPMRHRLFITQPLSGVL